MNTEEFQVVEENAEPSFFAMIPHMAIADLDPYALALYCQYKKVVAENPEGKCFMSKKSLAKAAKMGVTRMLKARDELVRRNYIQVIEQRDADGNVNQPPVIVLKNLWALNRQIWEHEYAKREKGESATRTPRPPHGRGESATRTQIISIEEEIKEKDSASKKNDAGSVRDSQDSQTSQHVPPKKTRQRKPNSVFDPIFDEIQKQFWNTTNGYGEHEDRQAQGGRIAKIAHWHCGKSYKGIRNIGKPATSENVDLHVKAVRRFREWLKETKNGITIHDLGKYVENYYEWRDTLIAQRFKVNGAKPKDWGAHEHTWYLDEGSQA